MSGPSLADDQPLCFRLYLSSCASGNVTLEAGGTVLSMNASPYSHDVIIFLVAVGRTHQRDIFGFSMT